MWPYLIGIVLLIVSFVQFFLAYKLGWKYMIQEERCTSKTTGRIVGYSMVRQGESPLRLPKVEYETNQGTFKITGPEYRSIVTSSFSSPFRKEQEVNYTTDVYSQKFRYHIKRNSMMSVERNPMAVLFPVESEIDVFYDPYKPELAYALRYANKKWLFYLFMILDVSLLMLSIFLPLLFLSLI